MEVSSAQIKKIEGVVKYLAKYLHYRSSHLVRCCPKIKTAISDVRWHAMDRIRELFAAIKMFGTDRYMIIDVLTGENDHFKRGLYNPQSQYSILADIIDRQAATTEVGSGVTITNIQQLYKFIDHTYDNLIELIQTWFWWDLRDAVENYLLDTYLERMNKLKNIDPTQPVIDAYKKVLNKTPDETVTKEEILQYEGQKILTLFKSMKRKRSGEASFQKILARDPFNRLEIDNYIIEMAESIKRTRSLLSSDELSEDDIDFYSRKIKIKPEDVTIPKALKYEETEMNRLEKLIGEYLETTAHLGEPYNLKMKETEDYEKKINATLPTEILTAKAHK